MCAVYIFVCVTAQTTHAGDVRMRSDDLSLLSDQLLSRQRASAVGCLRYQQHDVPANSQRFVPYTFSNNVSRSSRLVSINHVSIPL